MPSVCPVLLLCAHDDSVHGLGLDALQSSPRLPACPAPWVLPLDGSRYDQRGAELFDRSQEECEDVVASTSSHVVTGSVSATFPALSGT